MAKGYRPVERDQQFLLPPDMREWLPKTHPVWAVITIVDDHLDTSAFHASRRTGGVGRAGYDPDMVLTLLIWAWSRGMRSSRKIETACHHDVAYRIICAGDAPDHATISRFRKDNHTACEELFTQVLILAAQLGLGKLETIALDGVKIASNASLGANRSEAGLRAAAQAEAEKIAAAAAAAHAATDAAEDALHGEEGPGPDQVPAELADPATRSARIAEALAQIEAEKKAERDERDGKAQDFLTRLEAGQAPDGRPPIGAAVALAQQRLAEAIAGREAVHERYRQRQEAAAQPGHRAGGKVPKPVDDHFLVQRRRAQLEHAEKTQVAAREAESATSDARRRNITDPQSRPQPLRGGGWVQGYNCQAFTSEDGLILATGVGASAADCTYYSSMVERVGKAAQLMDTARREPDPAAGNESAEKTTAEELIGIMLFDAGYCSTENITAPGPDRLIATGKMRALEKAAAADPATGAPPPDVDPLRAMEHRLRTEDGIATYRKRSFIAETPFAQAKHNLGFRRFTSRGLDRASSEWSFHAAVHNIGKILTHLTGAPLPVTG